MTDRVYATASQHLELCQHICWLLNTRRPIATSTRLYLLDFLIDLRPSPENRIYRLDTRTYHVLRRVLTQIGEEMNVGERHFLQDVLRWTVDCHRERVVSRLHTWDGNDAVGGGHLPERIQGHVSGRNNSVRCHRCHQYGNIPFGNRTELKGIGWWTVERLCNGELVRNELSSLYIQVLSFFTGRINLLVFICMFTVLCRKSKFSQIVFNNCRCLRIESLLRRETSKQFGNLFCGTI